MHSRLLSSLLFTIGSHVLIQLMQSLGRVARSSLAPLATAPASSLAPRVCSITHRLPYVNPSLASLSSPSYRWFSNDPYGTNPTKAASASAVSLLSGSFGPTKFTAAQLQSYADDVRRDGHCVIRGLLDRNTLMNWNTQFQPLLQRHIRDEGHLANRGSSRYYVTLPWSMPWNDASIYDNNDILTVVHHLVGDDFVMCQLATDTPVKGSQFQELHRDTAPLFPDWNGRETPPYQLAVNFPLVDVTRENGPFETTRGSHMMTRQHAVELVNQGQLKVEPVYMTLGDVLIRDVRHVHRGSPNLTDTPRPMVVIGYSRRWLYRPEVSIQLPRESLASLSPRARAMLRTNPIVDPSTAASSAPTTEVYQSFAH